MAIPMPLPMPTQSFGKELSDTSQGISDFVGLFKDQSSSTSVNGTKETDMTTTIEEEVSPEKAMALLKQILEGTNGLAAVTSGQKIAGGYDSTTNQQLVNDLLARSTASIAALSAKKTQTQKGTEKQENTNTATKEAPLGWIVCTELNKQGKLDSRHYKYGARVFAAYDTRGKRGYYYWAIPAVKHLRSNPDSKLSKFLGVIFRARAEHLAAKAGCKEAKKSVFGAVVCVVTYAICWTLSRTVARQPIDFMSAVYPTTTISNLEN